MSAALQQPMSRDEFLDWVERQDCRFEFDGSQPIAMAGGTLRHDRLTRRLTGELERALAGKPCEVFGPNAGITTATKGVRYPDAVVTCAAVVDDMARLLPDPVAVFEVVSPTSGRTDRMVTLREYAAIQTIRRYVIVESDDVAVTVFWRASGNDHFQVEAVDPDGSILLPEIGVELRIAAIYNGIVAPSPDTGR